MEVNSELEINKFSENEIHYYSTNQNLITWMEKHCDRINYVNDSANVFPRISDDNVDILFVESFVKKPISNPNDIFLGNTITFKNGYFHKLFLQDLLT